MATYDFDQVLVWDVNPGGAVRTLRNASVEVVHPDTGVTLETVNSGSNGRATFTTTDVPTVILRTGSGFERRVTSQDAIEAAASFTVSEDAAVATLVNNPASATRAATDAIYETKTVVAGKVSKGAEIVNVKDYGAVGNGVTDDRAAIVNAMTAAATGGTILFPPGTYLVDAAVAIGKAVTWQGRGATIAKGAATAVAGNWLTANVGGVQFRDLTFTDPSSKVTGNYFTSGAAITGVRFERCTFNTPVAVAIRLARVTDGKVLDCDITACRVGIQVENDASRIVVRRVDITNWTDRGVYTVGTTNAPADVLYDTVRVLNFLGGGASRYPIMATKGSAPSNIQRLTYLNCTVVGPNKSYTAADPGTADQIAMFSTDDFRIVGCVSRNGGDMGITVDGACKRGVVANNVCTGNDASGIAIWTGSASISVTGNTSMNNGQNRNGDRTSYGRAGIRMISASHVAISGNALGDDQGTKTQNYGVSMTTCTNVSLGPDVDAGNALATYYKDGAGNVSIVKATTAAF